MTSYCVRNEFSVIPSKMKESIFCKRKPPRPLGISPKVGGELLTVCWITSKLCLGELFAVKEKK
ncbi:MAG: hypothetical protein ACEQSF_04480 [Solirubrobacteraceae bacterium]